MSAETVVFDVLRLDPGVAALVSNRIFPDVAPQEYDWPLIVYARSGSLPTFTIGGDLALLDVTVNVSCWAQTRPSAEALGDAVINAMTTAGHTLIDRRAGFDADTEGYASAIDVLISEF